LAEPSASDPTETVEEEKALPVFLARELFLQAVDNVGTTCAIFFETIKADGYELFVKDDLFVGVDRTDDRLSAFRRSRSALAAAPVGANRASNSGACRAVSSPPNQAIERAQCGVRDMLDNKPTLILRLW